MKKPNTKRFHSINFILWVYFLVFAVFILLLTWVFQVALLRTFYSREAENDLDVIGGQVSERIRFYMSMEPAISGETGGKEAFSALIGEYIDSVQDEHPETKVFVFSGEGELLYPEIAQADVGSSVEGLPDSETFESVVEYGCAPDGSVRLKLSDDYYVYAARVDGRGAASATDSGARYVYISYSMQLANSAFGTMQWELILVSIIVIFLALFISALLSSRLTKPLHRLTQAAQRMAKGDFTVNFKGEYAYAEIDALAETLDYAKEEIGKSDELQREVLANVTHDLKTPLTMIKAYASMIQEISGGDPEKRAKHTQVIIDESDRLTSLINDVLNLSKIRSGMDTLKLRVFDLSEIVDTVLERFGYLTETQGYTIVRDIAPSLCTEADVEKIEQVVYNLVGNAVNYTGEDKKITVALREEGNRIRFSVSDTGRGIAPEERETIWDRYYRSTDSHKRPIKGTGLGLSIVKTILVKHRFEYGVDSEVGKGSTFYVLFPLRDPLAS
mgnify:FL=1